ncbi:class I SAM-dependent methyltransferase [Streptomyces massasporeus]|uniref:class I SAM-dependent methyltransferase n=1 Tax=Streptomyces massasporeus TaxID=67324 RepID=UPI0033BB97A2
MMHTANGMHEYGRSGDAGGARISWFRYGVDAPGFVSTLGAAAAAFGLASVRWRRGRAVTATAGALLTASTGVYLHTTLRGKLAIWEKELDRAGLKGDEELLDLGCGRGAVLVAAAKRLSSGKAVGVDLWAGKDQSGNRPEITLANAAAAGVADRVEVHTADMAALPFADDSFDVVTSALAIHNIEEPERQHQALDEAMRVLRPGGRLIIADFWFAARRYIAHLGGDSTIRPLGLGYWYGSPWLGINLLQATKGLPGGNPSV